MICPKCYKFTFQDFAKPPQRLLPMPSFTYLHGSADLSGAPTSRPYDKYVQEPLNTLTHYTRISLRLAIHHCVEQMTSIAPRASVIPTPPYWILFVVQASSFIHSNLFVIDQMNYSSILLHPLNVALSTSCSGSNILSSYICSVMFLVVTCINSSRIYLLWFSECPLLYEPDLFELDSCLSLTSTRYST